MIIFNGVNLNQFLRVISIGGRGPISVTTHLKNVPGKNGLRAGKKQLKERVIPVTFDIRGITKEGLREKVNDLNFILHTEHEVPIRFLDEPDRTYYGGLEGTPDWDEVVSIGKGKGTIYLLCSDSKKIGLEKTYTMANQVNVSNNGTADAFPFIDIAITTATNTLSFTCNNKTIKLNRNFSVGDRVQLDFKRRKVFLNGVESGSILDFSSRWFIFKPGNNTITVSPTGRITGTVKFHERWL